MPTSNPTDILLAHDVWATRNIIDACSKLNDEQFHQRFEMGQGSLHDVLTHVTTHGMYHRAQCLNMLRHLGVTPLPLSSVIEWTWTADS